MSFTGLGTKRKGQMVRWEVKIPDHLAARVEVLCADPSTKRPVYGFRSQLCSELLEQWVREQEVKIKQTAKELLA